MILLRCCGRPKGDLGTFVKVRTKLTWQENEVYLLVNVDVVYAEDCVPKMGLWHEVRSACEHAIA
jgi:hypothetical protein